MSSQSTRRDEGRFLQNIAVWLLQFQCPGRALKCWQGKKGEEMDDEIPRQVSCLQRE
jgi:hypothetical protein